MWSVFTTLLGLVPGFTSLANAWMDSKVRVTMAQMGVDRDVAVTTINGQVAIDANRAKIWGAISASRLLTLLALALAVPVAVYEWKVVVVDVVIGPGCLLRWCWVGNTDPIHGDVAVWMDTIIWSLFGSTALLVGVQHWWTTRR